MRPVPVALATSIDAKRPNTSRVLYPAPLRDLPRTLAAPDASKIRRSDVIPDEILDEILDEVTRNAIGNQPDLDPEKFVEHTIASKRRAFPGVSAAAPANLIETLDNAPKDRHIAASAIAGGRRRPP